MKYECLFYWSTDIRPGGNPDIFSFESNCHTEALNVAIDAAKKSGAEHFNIGLYSEPLVETKGKKR